MLFSLQHRGQESCGIAWEEGGEWRSRRDLGMVASVLGKYVQESHSSRLGIGHVRYSTAGGSGVQNAQPIVVDCNKGRIALAHNGNISNGGELRSRLTEEGSIFQGTADSELLLHAFSRSRKNEREGFLREALEPLEGAYSLAMMHEDALIAVRDPSGFRPLYIGHSGTKTYVASETCALHALMPMDYREVEPGEVVIVDDSGETSFFLEPKRAPKRCVFELIYFARPDSEVFGRSVHAARVLLGEALAEQDCGPARPAPTLVIPVPDSGNISAIGYARRSGLPFDFGLARSHYAGRSFILPTKDQRELMARLKLHAVPEVVAGKRVVMIDDSLVRGTTSRIIVRLLARGGREGSAPALGRSRAQVALLLRHRHSRQEPAHLEPPRSRGHSARRSAPTRCASFPWRRSSRPSTGTADSAAPASTACILSRSRRAARVEA